MKERDFVNELADQLGLPQWRGKSLSYVADRMHRTLHAANRLQLAMGQKHDTVTEVIEAAIARLNDIEVKFD